MSKRVVSQSKQWVAAYSSQSAQVVPVYLDGRGYDFALAQAHLRELGSSLTDGIKADLFFRYGVGEDEVGEMTRAIM